MIYEKRNAMMLNLIDGVVTRLDEMSKKTGMLHLSEKQWSQDNETAYFAV